VPPNYDSLIGKVIAYGEDRDQAIRRMRIALSEMQSRASRRTSAASGTPARQPRHQGGVNIHYLEQKLAQQKKRDTPR